MGTKNIAILFILGSMLLIHCGRDQNTVMFNFVARYYFGENYLWRDGEYKFSSKGKQFYFRPDVVKMYLSDIQLTHTSGTATVIKDVSLLNLQEGNTLSILETVPTGTYSSIELILGLNESKNNSNPNDYNSDHPLSTAQAMYWGMLKYRFVIIEGKVLDSNKTILNSVSYHTGIDLSKSIVENINLEFTANKPPVVICKIDLKNLFNGLDPLVQNATHSSPGSDYDIAKTVTENISGGITWAVQ